MSTIYLETKINAPIERVFDLSRSIDLHKLSTHQTDEEAIAGVTSGLIGLNESVTWRARHFGITQKLTSKVTDYKFPIFFADEMQKGAFKGFRHEHYLESKDGKVIVKDIFDYKSPFGFLGKVADYLFLKSYMKNFLRERNMVIKEYAESGKWKEVLGR